MGAVAIRPLIFCKRLRMKKGLKLQGFPGRGTFSRGVHPPHRKRFSADRPIEIIPTPDKVVLPLQQHIGAPSKPLVKKGEAVSYGHMIAKGSGFVSASLHSPISGTVQKDAMITLPNGRHINAIVIKAEGEQIPESKLKDDILNVEGALDSQNDYEPDIINEAILNAGIVGLGGAAFPTHVKILPNSEKPIHTLVINGCECEPYLTADDQLMIEAPDTIVAGAILAGKAVHSSDVVVCIENNKPKAIDSMKKAAANTPVKVAIVKTKYPQGSEKTLIKALLNLEVPLGGLPADVGVAMSNVGTISAVARAVVKKQPLTHRVISVTGGGVNHPKNVLAPIGISMGELIDFCGGLTDDAARMVAGGPMMGFAFTDMTTPATKGTSGITVLTHKDIKKAEETSCVRCGRCADVCPMHLVPTRIALAARNKDPLLCRRYNISACFECGSCAFICPAQIPLVQLIRTGKTLLSK